MTTSLIAKRSIGVAAGLLMLVMGGFVAPEKAHAQFAVVDVQQFALDFGLDTLAWNIANLAIESMTKSMVNWINSGFDGSPAFVTDLNQNLSGVSDAVAARFFTSLVNNTTFDIPFQDRVIDSVRLGYYLSTSPESFYVRHPYTLNQVSPDDRAFLEGDFSQGGFNAWFATVMEEGNNPYDSRILLERELSESIGAQVDIRNRELDWGKGFLSWKGECTAMAAPDDVVSLTGADPCLAYETKTPGSVIVEQLNGQLKTGVDRAVQADDFNEIISALLNQLVKQVLGGDGLSGTSRPSSGGGASFLDRTSGSTGTSSSIGTTFVATIDRQIKQLETFSANWEKIRTAAEGARAQCGANGTPSADSVLARASAALSKSANAIAALEGIKADAEAIVAAGSDRSQALLGISEQYSALTVSGTLPTPEEIVESQVESKDTGDTEPMSLYTKMQRQASGSCSASGT